jgi:hypothetical protein
MTIGSLAQEGRHFLRTEDRRQAFRVALDELRRTRALTQALLQPLGLTQKDFREQRLQHGPAKKTAMDRLLGYLEAFTMPDLEQG